MRTLVAHRITGIALGHEDLNDHDELRRDPLLALLSGSSRGCRKGCALLAGKSTLSRLEHAPAGGRPDRYRRICHDPEKLQDVLAELFIDSWQGLPPERLVLDIDSTDDPVHGRREGRFFPRLLRPLLPPAAVHPLRGTPALRPAQAGQRRSRRGCDRAARPRRRPAPPGVAMAEGPGPDRFRVCPRGTDGVAQGQRRGLRHRPGQELPAGRADPMATRRCCSGSGEEGPARAPVHGVLLYATRKSWSCERRVIAKAEHLADKANPRFVVTSLPPDTFSARTVYERLYCQRGNSENAIKDLTISRPDLPHYKRTSHCPLP